MQGETPCDWRETIMDALTHDTVRLTQHIDASVADAWAAYADSARRAKWSVPAGEKMVYDEASFREGGRDRYRCGSPENLEFHAEVEYTKILSQELIVYAETVNNEGNPLATGIVTWEFEPESMGTLITITSQIVSFVGAGMIDGNRNGHTKALEQLSRHLAER